jgi:CYTH domain-containing protein
MSEPLEIEVKYLVNPYFTPEDYNLKPRRIIHIWQGYTVDGIRVAALFDPQKGLFDHRINIKSGSGYVRTENKGSITHSVFQGIWPLTLGRRIFKTRHIIPIPGETIVSDLEYEIDIYLHSRIYPLITAEVEVGNKEMLQRFMDRPTPEWIMRDVTTEKEYHNINLAC